MESTTSSTTARILQSEITVRYVSVLVVALMSLALMAAFIAQSFIHPNHTSEYVGYAISILALWAPSPVKIITKKRPEAETMMPI